MKGLMIIVRAEKLDAVKKALQVYGNGGMTVTKVNGCGKQQGKFDPISLPLMPGADMGGLLSKMRIDVVVPDDDVEKVIDEVCAYACTGRHGDGKIFVYDVLDAVRIRTHERGEKAL